MRHPTRRKSRAIGVLVGLLVTTQVCHAGSNGAAASTTWPGSMFSLYADNRTRGIGNHITTDFVLGTYGVFFGDLIAGVEERTIMPSLTRLVTLLSARLEKEPRGAARERARAYVAVLSRLLLPDAKVPAELATIVKGELALVDAAQGIQRSVLSGLDEDYSQYRVRGRYAASETLSRYFRASLYAGRMGFLLVPSAATGVSAEAASVNAAAARLLAGAVVQDPAIAAAFEQADSLLTLFVGASDDLTPSGYLAVAGEATPSGPDPDDVLDAVKESGRLPRIVSMPVDVSRLEPGRTPAEVTLAFRLLGQRRTPESSAFQGLVFDRVGEHRGSGEPMTMVVINGTPTRGFPSVLDLPAALGSDAAANAVRVAGDDAYSGYPEALAAAALGLRAAAHLPTALGETPLRAMDLLAGGNVDAAIGLWIRSRHDLMLYAKQSYTVTSRSMTVSPGRKVAAIDPEPSVYDPLIEACDRARLALTDEELSRRIADFREVLARLRAVAHRMVEGPLGKEDISLLNEVDRDLRGMVSTEDGPVVVDLHTDPTSAQVLEAAIGFPRIEARGVPDGELRGARVAWHQFRHPMGDRLTDEAWRAMLESGKAPPPSRAVASGDSGAALSGSGLLPTLGRDAADLDDVEKKLDRDLVSLTRGNRAGPEGLEPPSSLKDALRCNCLARLDVTLAGSHDRAALMDVVGDLGGDVRTEFENHLYVDLPVERVRELAARPEVWTMRLDRATSGPMAPGAPSSAAPAQSAGSGGRAGGSPE